MNILKRVESVSNFFKYLRKGQCLVCELALSACLSNLWTSFYDSPSSTHNLTQWALYSPSAVLQRYLNRLTIINTLVKILHSFVKYLAFCYFEQWFFILLTLNIRKEHSFALVSVDFYWFWHQPGINCLESIITGLDLRQENIYCIVLKYSPGSVCVVVKETKCNKTKHTCDILNDIKFELKFHKYLFKEIAPTLYNL